MSDRFEREYLREDRQQDEAFEAIETKIGAESIIVSKEPISEEDMQKIAENPGILIDAVEQPSHYMFFDTEAINIIKASLSKEEYIGYLKGNALKYRLRCGKKDDAMQDLKKAEQYEKMFKESL